MPEGDAGVGVGVSAEAFDAEARRGRREPAAVAAALAKRHFVRNVPYVVSGFRGVSGPPPRPSMHAAKAMWEHLWRRGVGGREEGLGRKRQRQEGGGEEGGGNEEQVEDRNGAAGGEPMSMSDRWRKMKATRHARLAFGKSAIHGWGLFTKARHCAGDMVVEYAGEVVRSSVADFRERSSYDTLVGAGTYMFRIDEERVVDATRRGAIAHLINHACEVRGAGGWGGGVGRVEGMEEKEKEVDDSHLPPPSAPSPQPNCYSRVIKASTDDRIIIFAKRDLKAGEELTYDYR